MPLQVFDEDGTKRVIISESLTINDVSSIKNQLEELFTGESIIFDLSQLSEFDSAGLQLLYTFKRDREKEGLNTKFEVLSDVVNTFLQTYKMEL